MVISPEDTTITKVSPFYAGTAVVPNHPNVKARLIQDSEPDDGVGDIQYADFGSLYEAVANEEIAYGDTPLETYTIVQDAQEKRRLIWSSYATGDSQQIGNPTNLPMTFATSRFGELYVVEGDEIRLFDTSASPLDSNPAPTVPVATLNVPGLMDIAYDDRTDRLIMVIWGAQPKIQAVRADLDPTTLTPQTSLTGFGAIDKMEIAADPISDAIWILNHADSKIACFNEDTFTWGSPALETHSMILPGELRNLQIDEQGDAFFRQDNLIRHYIVTEAGSLLPRTDSPRWGLETNGAFAVTIGRDSSIQGIHDQPEWAIWTPTGDAPCPADLDNDGGVNGSDLGLLLSGWGAGTGAADLNADGVVDGGDLGLLLAAWGSCN
jgi:hypothetical protein